MKIVLFILAMMGLSYYVINNHSPFQTVVTDPYYVEIRIDIKKSNVQLVGFGKMHSYADCQARAAMVWMDTFEQLGKVNIDTNCRKDISKKYQKLFVNQNMSATYVAFDKGSGGERDGRFLFYGVPSSYVYNECKTITQKIREKYSGKIYCVEGNVG